MIAAITDALVHVVLGAALLVVLAGWVWLVAVAFFTATEASPVEQHWTEDSTPVRPRFTAAVPTQRRGDA